MRFSIRAMLLASLVALIAVTAVTNVRVFTTLADGDAAMRELHDDPVVMTRELASMADAYNHGIVGTARKMGNGELDWSAGLASIREAIAATDASWATVIAADAGGSDESDALAAFSATRQGAEPAITELLAILEREDGPALDALVDHRLSASIGPISDTLRQLVALQFAEAEEILAASLALNARTRDVAMVLLVIATLVALGGMAGVLFRVARPVGRLTAALHELARGDLMVTVPGLARQDELGDMARAVETLRSNLAAAAAEKRAALQALADRLEQEVGTALEQARAATSQMSAGAAAMAGSAATMEQRAATVAEAAQQTTQTA